MVLLFKETDTSAVAMQTEKIPVFHLQNSILGSPKMECRWWC